MAKKIKLTIGMAVYEDYAGFWFTCQALLMYFDLSECELMVIDNRPGTKDSDDMKSRLQAYFKERCAKATYIAAGEVTGTTYPRELIFRRASGKYVMCIDSHVLLVPGSVEKLIKWFDDHQDFRGLIQGPLLLDNQTTFHTQFRDVWRGEMWGIWGNVWEHTESGLKFSVDNLDNKCQFVSAGMNEQILNHAEYPFLPVHMVFAGHENRLEALGFRNLGTEPDDEFEIPGQGLGLFACRRDAWPGFNKHFKGFGGEEMYIHEKFRQRGDKTLCLGFLKWLHKFSRAGEVKYPLTRWNKIRNYVLGHNELKLPLDRVHEHFVKSNLMPEHEWEYLTQDPINHVTLERKAPSKRSDLPRHPASEVFHTLHNNPRDLNQHMPILSVLALKCKHITEFSTRRESLVAFMSSSPDTIVSHNTEGGIMEGIIIEPGKNYSYDSADSMEIQFIDETDMLFLDTIHTEERMDEELSRFGKSVKRYIVMHDTLVFGVKGEGGGKGIIFSIDKFLKANPEWFVVSHTDVQYGLTVLGRMEEDRPAKKIHLLPPGYGPGTELTRIISEVFGIESSPTCDCKAKANQMDKWGVEGCEGEHFNTVVGWIRDNYERWGWKKAIDGEATEEGPIIKHGKIRAFWKSITSGLVFKINPANPFESLVRVCIENAREKEAIRKEVESK